MVLHGIACYCIVLHGITYHCMVLHGIAWYGMVSHVIAWFFMFSSYFILSSRDDETQQMKLVWNMRLEKMENTGAPVFKVKQDPNMQMIELSEGPAVDKTGEKVFLSHLGKWVKLIKFEAESEFFLHLEG